MTGEKERKNMSNENIEKKVTELDKALADKFINCYTLAVENGKKYAWKIAEVVYNTVNNKDFDKAFSSQHEYAVAIGFSDSKINKAISCYEKHLHLIENNQPNFSLGQIEETAKIEIEEMDDFIADTKVNETTTIKEMRKAVKTWLNRNNEDIESPEDEEITVEDINNNFICTFEYNRFTFTTLNIEVAEKIKKFIEENFLNK